jgi:uncharacterized membrane protein YccF (DUF307 family)
MKRLGFVNSLPDRPSGKTPIARCPTLTLVWWIYLSQFFSILATPVVVATYNVENFHVRPYGNRPVKSEVSRAMTAGS